MGRALVVLLAVCCMFSGTAAGSSHLDTSCNRLLGKNSSQPDIVYYRRSLSGSSEKMHFAWSMLQFPTLFVSRSNDTLTCSQSINTTGYHDNQTLGSASIPGTDGKFAAAFIFHRLIEFNVTDKNPKSFDVFNATEACDSNPCTLNDTSSYCSYSLDSSKLKWSFDNSSRTFYFNETQYDGNSTISHDFRIQLFLADKLGKSRIPYFPHSILTENNTVFDFLISNYSYLVQNQSSPSRLALELLLVHGPNVNNGSISSYANIDDEYTPAVFKTYQYQYGNFSPNFLGYMQWKPIAYTNAGRQSTSSQQINVANTTGTQCDFSSLPSSLASALFNGSSCNVTRFYLVFGTSGDDSDLSATYLTWTGSVGYGGPPQDEISLTVIVTIAAGLGIPILIVLLGGVFVVYKRKPWTTIARLVRRDRGGYSPLN